jgi:hypothetical protein
MTTINPVTRPLRRSVPGLHLCSACDWDGRLWNDVGCEVAAARGQDRWLRGLRKTWGAGPGVARSSPAPAGTGSAAAAPSPPASPRTPPPAGSAARHPAPAPAAHPGNPAALTRNPRCIRRNIDACRETATASRLNNPKSPRATTPTPPHQAKSSPYRTPQNVASAAIKPVFQTRSPSALHVAATPTAASPATSPSPRPSSTSAPAGRSSCSTPGPLRSATSTRTAPTRAVTVTVTVSPGAPEPLCWRLLAKIAHQQEPRVELRVGLTEHPGHERAGQPHLLRHRRDRHALRNRRLAHQPPAFPGPPCCRSFRAWRRHRG